MRKKLIAGNWKMNGSAELVLEMCSALQPHLSSLQSEVLICPPFTLLRKLREAAAGTSIQIGAQNVHSQVSGAFTGEIAAPMLQDCGVSYCLVGHSERRSYFGETDALVRDKVAVLLQHAIQPVVCVGETLEQREQEQHEAAVAMQLRGAFSEIAPADQQRCIVAYEPVWAIGTGRTATPEQANEMHSFIRQEMHKLASPEIAQELPILYGGSANAQNAESLLAQPEIDGALVGGASLKPKDFLQILQAGG
ncbi:MAG: triose-phosphate isomerase [bacterium]